MIPKAGLGSVVNSVNLAIGVEVRRVCLLLDFSSLKSFKCENYFAKRSQTFIVDLSHVQ